MKAEISEEVVKKHFLDSCMLLCDREKLFSDKASEPLRLVDVGTGAGFPGLPLKIMRPEVRLTLIDSLRKRVDFLQDTVETLGLQDVDCVHARAEDAGKDPAFREGFDIAVSRAVARLNVLSEYVLPFVKVNGLFVAYKSQDVEEEIEEAQNAFRILGGEVERVSVFTLPGTDHKRSLVYIRKKSPSPEKYPRKAGKPEKAPL